MYLVLFAGRIKYRLNQSLGEEPFDSFKFDVIDNNGNTLMDQTFYIDIIRAWNLPPNKLCCSP